jgi:hypothetical protein
VAPGGAPGSERHDHKQLLLVDPWPSGPPKPRLNNLMGQCGDSPRSAADGHRYGHAPTGDRRTSNRTRRSTCRWLKRGNTAPRPARLDQNGALQCGCCVIPHISSGERRIPVCSWSEIGSGSGSTATASPVSRRPESEIADLGTSTNPRRLDHATDFRCRKPSRVESLLHRPARRIEFRPHVWHSRILPSGNWSRVRGRDATSALGEVSI